MPITYSEFNQLWSQVYRLTCSQEEMQKEIKRLKSDNSQLKYDNDLLMKESKDYGRKSTAEEELKSKISIDVQNIMEKIDLRVVRNSYV